MNVARSLFGLSVVLLAVAFAKADSLNVEIESLRYQSNIRRGTKSVVGTLKLTGPDAARVVAARAIISLATEDAGLELKQEGSPSFYTTSVGSVSGDHSEIMVLEPITFALSPTSAGATHLRAVEGHIEVFIPERDPDTLVVVDSLAARFGSRIDSPGLQAAGVTLVVYDKASTEKYRTQDSEWAPQNFDSGPWFIAWPRRESLFPPGLPPAVQTTMMNALKARAEEMPATVIGVGIQDPHERLLPVEFQDKSGAPLQYNHNGNYHSSRGTGDGKRFDGYDLRTQFPADGKMVCWVMTDKSLESVPFKLSNVQLPSK